MRSFSGFSIFPRISFYFIPSFKFLEFSHGVKTVRHNDGRSFSASYPRTHLVGQNHHKHFIYSHIQRCLVSRHSCHGDPFDPLRKPLGKLLRNTCRHRLDILLDFVLHDEVSEKCIFAPGVLVEENLTARLGVMTSFETDRAGMASTRFPWR